MNNTAITIIKAIINDTNNIRALKEISKIKDWQFNNTIKKLIQEGFIKKQGNTIKLQENAKTILLKKIAQNLNVTSLLQDSNELVFSYLSEPLTVNEIQTNTGLSTSTIYRAISDLGAIGVLQKQTNTQSKQGGILEKIQINPDKTKLVNFARILKIERDNMDEPDAVIIYSDKEKSIKKVPKGKKIRGELTAFSLFTDNGIMYDSPYDYYIKQQGPLDIHGIIIHSVLLCYKTNDKLGLVISMIFYIHNKNKIDTKKLRKIAASFGIASIWLDVEAYIRRQELKNKDLFLPWNEFISKAELYDIKPEQYTIPIPAPSLFEEIGDSITDPLQIFLIGGENMRLKNLKIVTKDCDIVVERRVDFEVLSEVFLKKLGYKKMVQTEYSQEDLRLYPDEIFIHQDRSRVDLFTKKILQDMSLSDVMVQTADYIKYGKLRVGILRNEHVFVLKAVTSRAGDIQDMEALVQGSVNQPQKFEHGKFDWGEVWREIIHQEKMNPIREMALSIFDQISIFSEQTKIIVPILDKLQKHVIDQLILRSIRGGRQSLKYIVSQLSGGDISEQMIRNRIDAQVKKRIIRKYSIKKKVFVDLVQMPYFPYKDMQMNNMENMEKYLSWRFPMREQATRTTIKACVEELFALGYDLIEDVDNLIIKFMNKFLDYEQLYFAKNPYNTVGMIRVCVGLSDSSLAKNSKSNFYITHFENFIKTEKSQ